MARGDGTSGTLRRIERVLAGLLLSLALALPAAAQTLLRDAELERALRELARPVIAAAGLSPATLRILLIEGDAPNALVADSSTILITSGLFLRMDRPEMLQAVIAHEVAHLANGHLARRMSNMKAARNAALLGLAASAALARESPAAAAGIAAGTSSSAMRRFFGHTRAEEAAADQAGMRYLARAGIEPDAMAEVLEIFAGQEALSGSRQDPYMLTHPLSRDRLRAARGVAAALSVTGTPDPAAAYWFARSRAKLSAYLRNPSWTLRRIERGDSSDAALVARAVAHSQQADGASALSAADALVARRPDDPYAHELRAWVLFEARSYEAAVPAYARAAELAPGEPLIRAGYGRALLATGADARALEVLESARARDRRNPALLRDLALAQARTGQTGAAALSTAERYALAGRLKDAAIHATRAEGLLPRGSEGWRRAQDILIAAETDD
ncbi:MAG: M48 family metalloprotease [Paracoccaceae bacterium]|jgi:predicted Zn-dependent protease|nr:M48 family metalloprotease [Paracoccaceae bacterium]